MDPYDDVQGYFLRIPYDFRIPTTERIKNRVFNPAAAPLTPHVWGWGYTLNLGNPLSWVFLPLVVFSVIVFS